MSGKGEGLHARAGMFDPASCPICAAACLPMASFCSQCGCRLQSPAPAVAAEAAIEATRRQVTVVFCDLVGSTQLASGHDPEDVADLLRVFHGCVAAVMAASGGYFARPMGDGGLFYFGYPLAAEDDAERAIRASLAAILAVQRLPTQLGSQLEMRIGIAAGLVVVGDILGFEDPRRYDIVGDAVNLAARLQHLAAPGTVLVSEAVHRLTRNLFEFDDLGPQHVRSWPEALQTYRPLCAVPHAHRFQARQSEGLLPLVGRQAEVSMLGDAWDAARRGRGRVVLLTGEPGLGKSRLVHELLETIVSREIKTRRYFCAAQQQNVPLHPFVDQLVHVAGLVERDDAAARLTKLACVLDTCPEQDLMVIGELVAPGSSAGRAMVREASPERQRGRIVDALIGNLLRVAQRGPMLVVVEDAHWSDPTSRELLARLVTSAPTLPLMLVITTRPQFRPDWAAEAPVLRLDLEPLTDEDGDRLARRIAGSARLPADIARRIVARSDGIPLYIEELTKSYIDVGQVEADVPASLHASLLARIDRLGAARNVAEMAAVVGREFDLDLLAAAIDETDAGLPDMLERLVSSGLVRPSGEPERGRYKFRHALIWDTAYGTIVRERRRALHRRVAASLETRFPARAAAQPQAVAHHYTSAGATAKAAQWWLRAGLQSLQRSAMTEGQNQIRQALLLVEELPQDEARTRLEIEILVVHGKLLMATVGHAAPQTVAVFERARALCEQFADPPHLLTVLFQQWTRAFFRVEMDEAESRARDMLARARQRDDGVWLVMGSYTLGLCTLLRGRVDEAVALLRSGVAQFDPTQRHLYAAHAMGDARIIMRVYLAWALMMRGETVAAERELEIGEREARELGQRWTLAMVLSHRTHLLVILRGAGGAAHFVSELTQIAGDVAYYSAIAKIELGWYLAAIGQHQRGFELACEGRLQQVASGTPLHVSSFLRLEATMLVAMDRLPEALAVIEEGKRVQVQSGEHWDDAEFHRQRADILARQGRRDAARAELSEALRICAARNHHLFGLRAACAFAELLAEDGQLAQARAIIVEARTRVDGDAGITDIGRADSLLHRLRPSR